jgi:hypothetical protein
MQVLILARPDDLHVAAVEAVLRRHGAAYHLYDPTTFPAASRLSFIRRGRDSSAYLSVNGERILLDSVRAVWDRYSIYTKRLRPVRKDWPSYIAAESRTFLDGLYYLLPHAFWVNDPIRLREAEIKLRQLQLAVELGLTVPDTYVGNDPAVAAEIVRAHDTLALKTLHRNFVELDLSPWHRLRKAFYDYRHRKLLREYANSPLRLEEMQYARRMTINTRRFRAEEAGPYVEALPAAPVVIQQYIPKALELRVTVVGSRAFPCAIYSQEGPAEAQVDWRNSEFALRHEAYQLPSEIRTKCIELVRRLGLQFGSIDMIVTPAGEHVFLENNASGQWLWTERMAGLPIAEAIADLLLACRAERETPERAEDACLGVT